MFAGEANLTPEKVQKIVTPFIEEWKTVKVPHRKKGRPAMKPQYTLSESAITDLSARVRVIGMNLNKQGLKGIHYHTAFQKHIVALAETFDCRGWTESAALFEDPEAAEEHAFERAGRVDAIWARNRVAVAIFEIDSTVKARSFQKLKEAEAPHKFWIYFGRDVWGFRMFLQKNDPGREITPILVPSTFVPSFTDQPGRVDEPERDDRTAPWDLSE